MSVTEKHLELLSAELKALNEKHKHTMLTFNSKALKENINPNQLFKDNSFEKYNESSKEELSIYLKKSKYPLVRNAS